MEFEAHLNLLKNMGFNRKRIVMRLIYSLIVDHHKDVAKMSIEEFVNAVTIPRSLFPQEIRRDVRERRTRRT